jgi:hypothetical protein
MASLETRFQQPLLLSDLATLGHEILVNAAIDLAVFTPAGIHADFIGEIAEQCEMLGRSLSAQTETDLHTVAEEVRQALVQICYTGKKLWHATPRRIAYEIPEGLHASYLQPAAMQARIAA